MIRLRFEISSLTGIYSILGGLPLRACMGILVDGSREVPAYLRYK